MLTWSKLTTSTLKHDFIAGSVVFLVAIPLCLGIALASGAPLFAGIIAGVIGGIIVGSLSESHISVSGPAAGMVAVVLTGVHELGGFPTFLLALMLAGVLQILIGYCKTGFIADYIPSNVIQGLLCAIGILIISKQLPFAFTYTHFNQEFLTHLMEMSSTFSLQPLLNINHHINAGAIIISSISLMLLIYLDKSNNRSLKLIPAPVIVVIFAAVINQWFDNNFPNLSQDSTELVNIPVSHSFDQFLTHITLPHWGSWTNPRVYLYAFILAIIASLETLLNLEGAEKLDKSRRYCSRNRELIAQGVGNMCSGFLGGLPITSVIVRSSVNIQSGAKSKLSTITHGFLILLTVVQLPHWINAIPLAALAAILIHVGYKLTKPSIYREMYAQGLPRFFPFLVTVCAIITFDLLTGIIIGLLTSFFFILKENSQLQLGTINERHASGDIKRIILPQQLSFLCKSSLISQLKSIPNESKLIIDARHTNYIDRDIFEVFHAYLKLTAPEKNITVNTLGFKEDYEINNYEKFTSVTTLDVQTSLTPPDIISILKEGNNRFVNNNTIHRSLPDEIKAVSNTQHPMAIILGCIDSRVPVETIFDMGMGDLFVSRVAGNVVSNDIIASLEFACNVAGAKVIIVLGHLYCGAIKAACESVAHGHLGELLAKIKPAVDAEIKNRGSLDSNNPDFIRNVTETNIDISMKQIYENSHIIKNLIDENKIGLIGAIYNIQTGDVDFHEAFFSSTQKDPAMNASISSYTYS